MSTGVVSRADTAAIVAHPAAVSRLQDRLDMQDLHDKLAHYVSHVQDLKYKVNSVDSSAFLESIQILEEGLMTLKNNYEKELDKARRENEDVSRARNEYAQQMNKNKDLAADLENRLAIEEAKNHAAQDELNRLHRAVTQKDAQIAETQHAMQAPVTQLGETQRNYETLMRENQDLKRKYEAETLNRQECQERNISLQERINFLEQVHRQESQDNNERLNAASQTILTLEAKIRELVKPDRSLTEMLARVREAADAQLRMYREESEQIFNRSLTALKLQIEEDTKKIEELTDRNVRMTGEIGELMATIRKMEGQMASMNHQKHSLEEIMQRERTQAAEHLQFLEKKLKDMQDVLVDKMRELNAARDAQLPLRAEIEALRALLDEEERRLAKLPELGIGPKPAYGQSGPVMPRMYRTMLSNVPKLPSPPATAPHQGVASDYASAVGPVRARSAPASSERKLRLVPSNIGQGKDYFDQMFNDLKTDTLKVHGSDAGSPIPVSPKSPSPTPTRPNNPEPVMERPASQTEHDYATATSSATGDIRILEVHPDGRYIRMVNTSSSKDEEFGGYLIQQNVGGHPVSVFRFPPRVRFRSNGVITVWSGANDPILHQPPNDFVFKEQDRWGTGPECTTILCKPTGQAVAWTTAAHRFTQDVYDNRAQMMTSPEQAPANEEQQTNKNNNNGAHGALPEPDMQECEELPELQMPVNGYKPEPIFLKREKDPGPSLAAQKHPHGGPPLAPTHSASGQDRMLTYGNDNSSVNRQARTQPLRPDPIPGAPYAGASAQRMGSASLRRWGPGVKPTITGSGAIANRAM